MLITKEQQEAWIFKYAEKHSGAETLGFIDGIVKVLDVIAEDDKISNSIYNITSDAMTKEEAHDKAIDMEICNLLDK